MKNDQVIKIYFMLFILCSCSTRPNMITSRTPSSIKANICSDAIEVFRYSNLKHRKIDNTFNQTQIFESLLSDYEYLLINDLPIPDKLTKISEEFLSKLNTSDIKRSAIA